MTSMQILRAAIVLLLLTLVGARVPAAGSRSCTAEAGIEKILGQLLYVPAYSDIPYLDEKRRYPLAVTLSMRNTDGAQSIIITSVRYFDGEGRLIRTYVEQPLRLGPLASTARVVEERDTQGGTGASFLVEWRAEVPVHAPVVEAVMIGTSGAWGISFTSPGRVLMTQCP
jgi:Protein of unknown function (DUF3124)